MYKILLTLVVSLTFLLGFNFNVPVTAQDLNINASNLFDVGLVSFNFDDGQKNAFTKAIPMLNQFRLSSDQYILPSRSKSMERV
jgi:hypothetical protein